MGKVRNKRFRLHEPAVNSSRVPDEIASEPKQLDRISLSKQSLKGSCKGKAIDVNALIKEFTSELEADADSRSVVTSKSLKSLSGQHLKKKDKHKIQHAVRMKQMMLTNVDREESIKKKKREQTAVVGDMKPLEDALPALDWLMKNHHKSSSAVLYRKPRTIEKQNIQKQQMVQSIEMLRAAAASSDFGASQQNNSFQSIAEHLRQSLMQSNKAPATES